MNLVDKIKIASFRFFRGFIASAVAVMAAATLERPDTWTDVGVLLNALAVSGTIAGMTGGLLALDKYLRLGE